MSRLVLSLCVLTVIAIGNFDSAHAQDGPVVGDTLAGELTLRELLEKDLRARRDVEFEFIRRVVARVEEKKIPLETVIVMYKWAKKKSHRPYQYFEKGMKVQAERLGVDLMARDEPEGGFRNFFRDLRVQFRRLSVQF